MAQANWQSHQQRVENETRRNLTLRQCCDTGMVLQHAVTRVGLLYVPSPRWACCGCPHLGGPAVSDGRGLTPGPPGPRD